MTQPDKAALAEQLSERVPVNGERLGFYFNASELQTLVAALRSADGMREALEELCDLMDDTVAGKYKPDSFTTQPARAALAAAPQAEGAK